MKLRNLLWGSLVCSAIAVFAACTPETENLGTPALTVSVTELTFDEAGDDATITLNATRKWRVDSSADWVVVTPASGEASADDQTVVVSALANTGGNRAATLTFTIGTVSKTVSVIQTGSGTTAPEEGITPISEVLKKNEGEAFGEGVVIKGVVISNMALNNLTSKKGMYVQDATGGLQFYLAADHSFALGTEVKIDLSTASMGKYFGAVQVSGLALDKITQVTTNNPLIAKTVTMADFLANKYEGQYIALEGVQVVADDLSKTWVVDNAHTSINMEDANGNKFVVFSSKYADDNNGYGTQTVAQGSGTIKGISSINNGKMQIIFAQASDYAGLTGARFEGTVVTPPAGDDNTGDDNTGDDNTGNDEPVTPPTGDATVASLVMNTLGLTDAQSVDGQAINVDDNITLTFKKGAAATAPAYYNASNGIRMYQNGATLDVKAAAGMTITSIKFTFDYSQWYFAPDCGELSAEGDVRTWTGVANAIKFTSTGTDKNHRAYIKAVEVTYYQN